MTHKYLINTLGSLLITAFIGCLLPANITFAYSENTVGGSLVATVLPKEPGPQTEVTITLNGYGYDINESNIVWALNGREQQRGIGTKSFKFNTGELGEISVITIALKTKEGRTIAKQLTFIPAEVDLLWEADTYVPSFYPGLPLPTPGSKIRITAIPQLTTSKGELIPSNELTFTWRHNYRNLVQESGRGKDSIEISAPSTSSDSPMIEVTVTSAISDARAYKKATIPLTSPELIIYPRRPLVGTIASEAITDTYRSEAEEESFIAEPYYFPKNEVLSDYLAYSWRINGEPVSSNIDASNILNISKELGASGESTVEVTAFSLNNNFIRAAQSFRILLDSGIFGL